MNKSSLIIDTPEHCYLCSCYAEYEDVGYCQGITAKRVPTKGKPSWCPLKPYKKVDAIPMGWIRDYCRKPISYADYWAVVRLILTWEKENGLL